MSEIVLDNVKTSIQHFVDSGKSHLDLERPKYLRTGFSTPQMCLSIGNTIFHVPLLWGENEWVLKISSVWDKLRRSNIHLIPTNILSFIRTKAYKIIFNQTAMTNRNNNLIFKNNTLETINYNNQTWITSKSLALALNYSSEDAVTRIYNRNSDEFTNKMV